MIKHFLILLFVMGFILAFMFFEANSYPFLAFIAGFFVSVYGIPLIGDFFGRCLLSVKDKGMKCNKIHLTS